MFKHVMLFSYRRNWKEAIGFYVAYLCLGLVLTAMAGVFSSLFMGAGGSFHDGFKIGMKIGTIVIVPYCLSIAFFVLVQRKLHSHFGYVLLALLSGLVAMLGGAMLGLLIPAFLTTRALDNSFSTSH